MFEEINFTRLFKIQLTDFNPCYYSCKTLFYFLSNLFFHRFASGITILTTVCS